MDALLLLDPLSRAFGYDGAGDFELANDGRIAFRAGEHAPFVFTGLQLISLSLLDGTPGGAFSMRVLWDKAARAGRLFGLEHKGAWMHVGDPAALKDAEARLGAAVAT
jgi:MurNAc alpha-1-phosphate uridylyltransferase